jgi:hypothetical protein
LGEDRLGAGGAFGVHERCPDVLEGPPFLGEGLFQAAGQEGGDVVDDGRWHVEGLVPGGHRQGIGQGQVG